MPNYSIFSDSAAALALSSESWAKVGRALESSFAESANESERIALGLSIDYAAKQFRLTCEVEKQTDGLTLDEILNLVLHDAQNA